MLWVLIRTGTQYLRDRLLWYRLGIYWKYVVTAKHLKLCLMKHMQSSIAHYSVILANNHDFLSKSNSSLYCLLVCSIIFQINTLDSFIIV